MQYEVNTPTEYLAALEEDWRKVSLQAIRQIIFEEGPELTEEIEYKMLAYQGENGKTVFHLNAQRNYVSLYVGSIQKIDPNGEFLEGLNMGKGCIRFKKTDRIAETQINEFIKKAIQLWKAGTDLEC